MINNIAYWNDIAEDYQHQTTISCDDFHYGPLIPGDSDLHLLPTQLTGKTCLELGCGAAQNSIFLARKGATCTAIDASEIQLNHAAKLAAQYQVDLDLIPAPLENLDKLPLKKYDLIHSSYALSFVNNPARFISNCADLLNPGGQFILSTGHPLAAGEWLELDDDGGMFIKNYLQPEPDIRCDDQEHPVVCSNFYSIETIFNWLTAAGLSVNTLAEPKVNLKQLSNVPYISPSWQEIAGQYSNIPLIIIFGCSK